MLICRFKSRFVWAFVTTVSSEPLRGLYYVTSVNFGRISLHSFFEFLKTVRLVRGVSFELLFDLS